MYSNNTVKFTSEELSHSTNVGWSRSHIGGYQRVENSSGDTYGIIVYTSILIPNQSNGIVSHKTFFLEKEEADRFIDWFHDSY